MAATVRSRELNNFVPPIDRHQCIDATFLREMAATQEGLMTVPDRTLAGHACEPGDLLCFRMAMLGLDLDAIERGDSRTFGELRQRCTSCDVRDACAVDLRRDPNDPVWEAYCPNSARLNSLTAEWWLPH